MKKKQKEEIRGKSLAELAKEILKKEEEALKLQMQIRMAQVKNTSSLRSKLDEIAVLKTILREKKFAEEKK
jgi:ribosomal protein L29